MIKIKVSNNKVNISGHALYDEAGKDIVCASVSSIVTTTINAIISMEDSISYEENDGKVEITINKSTKTNKALLGNMIKLLEELETQFPENIKIIK